jgi:hypothetical protein
MVGAPRWYISEHHTVQPADINTKLHRGSRGQEVAGAVSKKKLSALVLLWTKLGRMLLTPKPHGENRGFTKLTPSAAPTAVFIGFINCDLSNMTKATL